MLVDALKNYPVYFTSGNHDNYLNQIDELRRILQQKGVHVLEDEGTVFSKGNSTIEILVSHFKSDFLNLTFNKKVAIFSESGRNCIAKNLTNQAIYNIRQHYFAPRQVSQV